MKIGIVTLYKELNCGAYLQAYALKEKLTQMGHEVEFIDNNSDNYLINALKGGVAKRPYLIFYNVIRLIRYWKDQKEFNIGSANNYYDVVIIGSDELWNVSNKGFRKSSLYWGKNLNAAKIESYAVSCNNTTVEEMQEYEEKNGGDLFGRFNHISVRDEHTKEVIEKITPKEVKVIPDPTFLLEKYSVKDRPIKQRYILLYAYERSFSEKVQMEIMQYAKSKGLMLVSYNFYYEWCDKNVIGSPLEFATYVKYADYVITSTFHGSIFSILLNKQFISTNKENMKIKCLLDQFSLSSRHTDRVWTLDNEIDYKGVNIEIGHSRTIAEDYLKQIL